MINPGYSILIKEKNFEKKFTTQGVLKKVTECQTEITLQIFVQRNQLKKISLES